MPTSIMMNDIPIFHYSKHCEDFSDEYLFDMILEYYFNHKDTNIKRYWTFEYLLDFDEEENQDDEVIDEIENYNNINLSLIKKYAPEIYKTYVYDIKDNQNPFEMMHLQNIELCADIIHKQFIHKLYNYINNLEGAELSGSDTDTDE